MPNSGRASEGLRPLLAGLLLLAGPASAAPDPEAVQRALRVGDCAAVLAALTSAAELPDALALAGARCAARAGDEPAASAFARQAAASGGLSAQATLLSAEALLASADPATLPDPERAARAERALASLAPGALGAGLDERVRLLRDKALLAQGRGLEARDDLRALLDTELGPEARYWLAWAAERRGEPGPAATTWLASWIRDAASPWSERSAAGLAALGQPVPQLTNAEGRAQALQRVQVLRQARRPAEALALLRQVQAAGGPADAGLLAETCFEGRDYACAVEAYQRLGSPASVGPETLFDHALASYRAGDPEGAARLYTALYQRYPAHPKGDTASFKLGYAALDQGRPDDAIAELEKHLARFPASAHADEALWYVGWCHWKQGRPAPALAAWTRLQREHPSSSLATAAAYWGAVAGDPGQRDAALARLATRWPESGQAWFALQRLGRLTPVPAPPPPTLPALPAAFVAANPAAGRADALLAVGLDDLALAELRRALDAAGNADAATRRAVALRLVALGAPQRARSLADLACGQPSADPAVREICDPRPHAAVVAEVLRGSDLDPFLPFAIMLAESGMDPAVSSPAGARGLMQLMPEVGARLHAARFPDRPYDPDLLFLGAYNAALGTAELRRLHEHYRASGQAETLPMVIAAYNGGQEAVDRWLAAAGPAPALDAWAEDIAFSETRRYVRRVLGHLRAYHRAWGG